MSQTRPAARDFDMYRRSVLDYASQSELAKEHDISQQRVSQVLRDVERWIAAHPEDQEAQSLRVTAGQRLETVIALSMRAFRESQQEQEVVKERVSVRPGKTEEEPLVATTLETTRRRQFGDVRYLQTAMRAMERQARLSPAGQPLPYPLTAEPVPAESVQTELQTLAAALPEAVAEVAEPIAEAINGALEASAAELVVEFAPGAPVAVSQRLSDNSTVGRAAGPSEAQDGPAGRDTTALPQPSADNLVEQSELGAGETRLDAPHSGGPHRKRRRRGRNRRGLGYARLDLSVAESAEWMDRLICDPSPEG